MLNDGSVITVQSDLEVRILATSVMMEVLTPSGWRAKLEIWEWGDFSGLEIVQGAANACARAFHDVEVDHGG